MVNCTSGWIKAHISMGSFHNWMQLLWKLCQYSEPLESNGTTDCHSKCHRKCWYSKFCMKCCEMGFVIIDLEAKVSDLIVQVVQRWPLLPFIAKTHATSACWTLTCGKRIHKNILWCQNYVKTMQWLLFQHIWSSDWRKRLTESMHEERDFSWPLVTISLACVSWYLMAAMIAWRCLLCSVSKYFNQIPK